MKSSKKVILDNAIFLNKNNIIYYYGKGRGNVVTATYLGVSHYIGLKKFKFRKAGTNRWVQKTKNIFGLFDTIKIPKGFIVDDKFKNKSVKQLIDNFPNEIENFLYSAPILFKEECIEYLKSEINLETEKCYEFIMPFGKYQSFKLRDILEIDSEYLKWVVKNIEGKDFLTEKIKTTLELWEN